MTVQQKTIFVSEGRTSFGGGFLMFSKIIELCREGVGIEGITILNAWTSRDYRFNPTHGLVTLNPAEPTAPGGENIYILYKT